jgi:S-adenosylmethionine-dependent methyltransferase
MSSLNFEHLIVTDQKILNHIREVYATTHYGPEDAEFLATPGGQHDLDFNTFIRYNQSVRNGLPWVQRVFDMTGKTLIEIGCGTGSSTAAFAYLAKHIYTCDPKGNTLPTAQARLDILGHKNVSMTNHAAPEFFGYCRENYCDSADAVLFFAVLEHQTLDERIDSLRQAYAMLKPGGVIIVIETPSRLTFMDHHTTRLPFYSMLPMDVALRYVEHSPRGDFVGSMVKARSEPLADQEELMIRWGRGISYHEFDLAFPEGGYTIVADGYEREMTDLFPVTYDERLLQSFVALNGFTNIHPAFLRHTLCLIIQKGESAVAAPKREFTPHVATRLELERLRDKLDLMSIAEIRAELNRLMERGVAFGYQSGT